MPGGPAPLAFLNSSMSEPPPVSDPSAHDSVSLFFFSGTGNSYRAATWLAGQAQAAGLSVTLRPTNDPGDLAALPRGPDHLLGLLTPTHGFTAPWHVIKFACRLPRGRGAGAFVVASRAGTKLGRLFLPGMEGTACYLLGLILLLRGYRLRGAMGLDMPSNWLAVHPGFRESAARAIIDRAQPRAERFLGRILAGRTAFGYGSIVCLLLGLALAQVSLMYLVMARFMLAKLFFASPDCTGCGQCAAQCPVQAIRMWGKSRPRPYWRYGCESCMRCMAWCPTRAIEVGHSWAVLTFFLTNVPVYQVVLNWLTPRWPGATALKGQLGFWLIQYPYALLALALAYAVFSVLLRVPAVNYLFTYTTFTKLFRRYHAPGVSLADMREPPGTAAGAAPSPAHTTEGTRS